MNAAISPTIVKSEMLNRAVAAATSSIAPAWPLDRMIAVNPYWGRIQQPFRDVAKDLAQIAGSPLTLPITEYRKAWEQGDITLVDIEQALVEHAVEWTAEQLVGALNDINPAPIPLPLLSDRLDSERDLERQPAWCETITHQISQFCAAYFDRDQADWHPDQSSSLYVSWKESLTQDHSVALLMHTPNIPSRAQTLAAQAEQQIEASLTQLQIPESEWSTYLQAVLMRVSGWASWCAYRRFQAGLEGGDDSTLVDLLAIRLSWECLLDDGARGTDSLWTHWRHDWQQGLSDFDDAPLTVSLIWQRAQEVAYQRGLQERLLQAPQVQAESVPAVQSVFCIDVRSEVLRRHLEAQSPDIQTLGFAGFFGLPISYTPLGTSATRPQLPGLLAPALDVTDSSGDVALDRKIVAARNSKLREMRGWGVFQSLPLSSFTLVETLGLGVVGNLIKRSLPRGALSVSGDHLGLKSEEPAAICPTLTADVAGGVLGQAKLASQALKGMGLDKHLARIVLLAGHGSQNRNNPHKAGLDCGACCGQTGEVNARALAGLLNCPSVREELLTLGIEIPKTTHFVAGLHNTSTDEVQLFDVDQCPDSHKKDLEQLKQQLLAASAATRQERAPILTGLNVSEKSGSLLRALLQRTDDWAQTRPEWGLANNAAFVIASRKRTRGVDLQGRSFLHDYDQHQDKEGRLLEQIMTAPMLVTNWINMQYYASTVDNTRFGSGNKTLHNVVGGRIGVFEGNGGDLRIGLPWQSLNDGESWRHTPLRLTVVIEASREAIDRVIAEHETVRQLVHNNWLYLMRLSDDGVEEYANGNWQIKP